jgi:CBS domain-containing protein
MLQYREPGNVMFDELVKSVMQQEISLTVSPEEFVWSTAKLMASHQVSAVMVVEEGRLVGILTERDIVFRVVAVGLNGYATRIADVMTRTPVTVDAEQSFGFALLIMQEGGFRHLPVVTGGELVGIVSSRSAVDPALEEFVSEVQRRKHFETQRVTPL